MKCKEDHHKKMCSMTCCPCHIDLEELKKLVNNAKFICQVCGRVANEAENLCKPAAIN
jgi:hypothetical protein